MAPAPAPAPDEFPAFANALRSHARLVEACGVDEPSDPHVALPPLAAVLHAHRPRELTADQVEQCRERGWFPPYAECAGDGVLCVDSSENTNDYPCPTIELITRAIGALT